MAAFLEFEYDGNSYRTGKIMPVQKQLHVLRRIAPLSTQGLLVAQFRAAGHAFNPMEVMQPLITIIAGMPDGEVDYVFNECLGVVQRRQVVAGQEVWSAVQSAPGTLQFADVDLLGTIMLVFHVLRHNYSDFMAGIGRLFQENPTQPASIG